VDAEAATRFEALLVRRERDAEPVSHLLGSRAFYDLDVAVDRRVLTPRPETETLIEVFAELEDRGALPPGPVADWGTGSGVLAAVLRRWRPVLAVERSADARVVALGNLGCVGSGQGWMLVAGDGLQAVAPASLAAVLANPPYIEPENWDELPEDVRRHEPRQALLPDDGDVVGLYARLGAEAARCLVPGGRLLAEVGAGQAESLERALARGGLVPAERRRDLLGHERVLVLRRS
jgi:release factor glutamine methyltransferase